MGKVKSYHSLLVKENGKWSVQFGDYSKQVVIDEQQDMKESYGKAYVSKIITTNPDQASIDEAVQSLNKGV